MLAIVPALTSVRDWTKSDRAFVADAFLNTVRAGSDEAGAAEWGPFRAHWNKEIDRILDDPRTRVRIAGPDDLVILGVLVYRPPNTVHMLFVRKGYRRQGIGRLLLTGIPLEGATMTSWTRDLGRWVLAKTSREVARDKTGAPVMKSWLTYDPYWSDAT